MITVEQIKKLNMKQLKQILKSNKVKGYGKMKKGELVDKVKSLPNLQEVLSSIELKKTKKEMRKIKKATKKVKEEIDQHTPQTSIEEVETIPTKSVVELKEYNPKLDKEEPMKTLHEVNKTIQKVQENKQSKKDFLDSIFGEKKYNYKKELEDVIEECDEDCLLEKLLSMSKKEKDDLMRKKHAGSLSMKSVMKMLK